MKMFKDPTTRPEHYEVEFRTSPRTTTIKKFNGKNARQRAVEFMATLKGRYEIVCFGTYCGKE